MNRKLGIAAMSSLPRQTTREGSRINGREGEKKRAAQEESESEEEGSKSKLISKRTKVSQATLQAKKAKINPVLSNSLPANSLAEMAETVLIFSSIEESQSIEGHLSDPKTLNPPAEPSTSNGSVTSPSSRKWLPPPSKSLASILAKENSEPSPAEVNTTLTYEEKKRQKKEKKKLRKKQKKERGRNQNSQE
jgi:hypothetical protein